MILGTEARVRPTIELDERGTGIDLVEPPAWPSASVDSNGESYAVASESM